MALSDQELTPYLNQLSKLYEDANYSSQTYYEAAKRADLWGRTIVFFPALVGSVASALVAVGATKELSALAAIAGAVTATAAFIGTSQRASSFRQSANAFTRLRHKVGMESDLASRATDENHIDETVRILRKAYDDIVASTEPAPNRSFRSAQKQIHAGVLDYTE